MITTEKLVYQHDNHYYEGSLSWDDAKAGPRPVVMIAHTFRGQGAFENEKSVHLAGLGYLAFAIDLYGQGRRAATPEVAANLMNELNDNRPLLEARLLHTLETISRHRLANSKKVAAIGFCFGGKCVLDLARSGANVIGVVSFHGIYDAPDHLEHTPIKAAVLILHGWEDPLAKPDSLVALGQELTRKGADWQILTFGHTGHAFTNPNAKDEKGGMFYQPTSNARAWRKMQEFLGEVFEDVFG
ncbi:MAG: dienelactone hydrolase family protein [Saprospiraceae bacterium]|nr:dienelactone hydrolase family protein [Saprospiraceae bacterium]